MVTLRGADGFESFLEVQFSVQLSQFLRTAAILVLVVPPLAAVAAQPDVGARPSPPPPSVPDKTVQVTPTPQPASGLSTGSPNAATAGTASASQAKPDAKPTLEHIAKARKLILATGISRSFQIIIPEFMDQIGNTLTQARPDLVHDMNIVLDQLRPEFDKQSEEMIDRSAQIYATLLTEAEIDSVLAFFNSDAGKRYVGAQPLFLNQLVSGMQAWQQKIAINMMERVRQEMKKKGHEL